MRSWRSSEIGFDVGRARAPRRVVGQKAANHIGLVDDPPAGYTFTGATGVRLSAPGGAGR